MIATAPRLKLTHEPILKFFFISFPLFFFSLSFFFSMFPFFSRSPYFLSYFSPSFFLSLFYLSHPSHVSMFFHFDGSYQTAQVEMKIVLEEILSPSIALCFQRRYRQFSGLSVCFTQCSDHDLAITSKKRRGKGVCQPPRAVKTISARRAEEGWVW